MKLVDRLVEGSKDPSSSKNQFVARVLPVFIFLFFFPTVLFIIPSFAFDQWLQPPTLRNVSLRIIPGRGLIVLGLLFMASSTRTQRDIGKGTPMPLKATQMLVVEKPYSYCRNPLYFGLISFFLGISIIIGSISSLMMVLIFSVVILLYVKLIEEKELELRFGNAYREYKKATPLIIPRLASYRRKNE